MSPGHGKPHYRIDLEVLSWKSPPGDFHLVLGFLRNQHFAFTPSSKESPGIMG